MTVTYIVREFLGNYTARDTYVTRRFIKKWTVGGLTYFYENEFNVFSVDTDYIVSYSKI